jgi:hypothetical protein
MNSLNTAKLSHLSSPHFKRGKNKFVLNNLKSSTHRGGCGE